jgi:bacteriocin-type transport-associated protein
MEPLTLPSEEFNASGLQWLWTAGQVEEIAQNTVLIREGEWVDTISLVLAGSLSASVLQPGGSYQQVDQFSAGEMVGALPFISAHPSIMTITAIAPTRILTITSHQLVAKLQQDLEFAAHFYQTLSILLSQRLRRISALLARSQVVAGQALRKVLLVFGELNDSDVDWMIAVGKPHRAATNTDLIQAGKPVDALYLLMEGTLAVSVSAIVADKPISKEIAKLATGEIVGEMSFIDAQPPSATVKAVEGCLFLALPRQELATKLQQDIGFASRFYRAMSVVLCDRLQDRLTRHGYGKLAYDKNQPLDEAVEYEDELDMDVLGQVSLAAARFDWLLRRLRAN